MGDLAFERESEGQIEKFDLGWKLDRQLFPTSTLGSNFYIRKASKSGSKQGWHIEEKLLV